MNIFVGNLSTQTTETQLRSLFAEFGEVKSVNIVMDKYTNHSRGFGFVEMVEKNSGEKSHRQAEQQFSKPAEHRC